MRPARLEGVFGGMDRIYRVHKWAGILAIAFAALHWSVELADGLIKSLDDKVAPYVTDDGFKSDQNKDITWRHLLTQTSEWSGSVFGKEDRIDHNRVVGVTVADAPKGTRRAMKKPGTFYEYNDVRVNRLSYSLLQVFKEPLPQVLKRRIMDPIGGSQGWYDTVVKVTKAGPEDKYGDVVVDITVARQQRRGRRRRRRRPGGGQEEEEEIPRWSRW